jgi:hypothetical protein
VFQSVLIFTSRLKENETVQQEEELLAEKRTEPVAVAV